MKFRWESSGKTDVGHEREHNEDHLLCQDGCGLWLVADGMGGHERGDTASRIIVDAFDSLRPPSSIEQLCAEVEQRLHQANEAVLEESRRNTSGGTMGSTVVAFLAHDAQWACYWAGDSRAYLLREGHLRRLTRDHSVVQQLIDHGKLEVSEARDHPASNQITNAIGVAPTLSLDRTRGSLQDGDSVLLCSDGLYAELNEAEIATEIQGGTAQQAVGRLIAQTLQRRARDNITAIVIRIEENTLTRTA